MATSFDYLASVVGPETINKVNLLAQQYLRYAKIRISILRVLKFNDGKNLILVQVEFSGTELSEGELVLRALDLFNEPEFKDPKLNIDIQVVIKGEKTKYALSHSNTYLVGFEDQLFIGAIIPETSNTFKFDFDGKQYSVIALISPMELKRWEQVAKWVKHELIERKKRAELQSEAKELTIEELKKFFEEHISINQSSFSQEAGFSDRYLRQILAGDRKLTENVATKLLPIMERYGYDKSPFNPNDGGFVTEGEG